MSCAYHLAKAGKTVKVLEARGLVDGATGRNGGHSWPEPQGASDKLKIENEDMKAVRTFVLSLSEDWQKRIELRVNGGIDPFFEDKEDNGYFHMFESGQLEENPLDSEYAILAAGSDSDLPLQSTGGLYTSCAA